MSSSDLYIYSHRLRAQPRRRALHPNQTEDDMNGNATIPTESEHDAHYQPNEEEGFADDVKITPLRLKWAQRNDELVREIQKQNK